MKNETDELKREIESLKTRLACAEEILDKAPCFLYINEIRKTREENT